MRQRINILHNIDWVMVTLYLILVTIGWVNIYAAVYSEENKSILDFGQNSGKQLIWILSSLLIALTLLLIDPKIFNTFAYVIYGVNLVLLILVIFVGREISGSKSWFGVGDVGIQPAEFAKLATSLALARYLSAIDVKIQNSSTKVYTFILIALPVLAILLENDTGSALVFTALIFMLYREGLSGNILILGLMMVVMFFATLMIDKLIVLGIITIVALIIIWFVRKNRKILWISIGLFFLTAGFIYSVDYAFSHLEEHQKTRIDVLLGKQVDLKKAGYNVNQSKIAIGSGGFAGKGFLNGTQTKYNFVPEQSTDFIFCTIGEEWGFVGSLTLLGLFMGLLIRIVTVAERQRSSFSRIYGYALASILFFHITVNIGMTIGLFPVIGIPLPFVSYGGSSLWAFTTMLFIFIKQDSSRLNLL